MRTLVNDACISFIVCLSTCQLALVVQLDARPTEDQEVAGSTPAGSATFFHGD